MVQTVIIVRGHMPHGMKEQENVYVPYKTVNGLGKTVFVKPIIMGRVVSIVWEQIQNGTAQIINVHVR